MAEMIVHERKVLLNEASLYTVLTRSPVSCSHAQHGSPPCTDGIDEKFPWPASVGLSHQSRGSLLGKRRCPAEEMDLFSRRDSSGIAEPFPNFRLQRS